MHQQQPHGARKALGATRCPVRARARRICTPPTAPKSTRLLGRPAIRTCVPHMRPSVRPSVRPFVRPSVRELCVLVRDHAIGRASKRASVCARSRARAPVRPRARACVRSVYARSGPVLPLLGVSRQISTRPSRLFSANRLSILVTFETHGTGYQPPPNRFRASRLSNRGRPVRRSPAYRGTIPMPMYKICPLSTVRISRTPVWSGERVCETTSSRENGAKMLL